MKVLKRTGLVPVKFLVPSLPFKRGQIAGLPPAKALAGLKAKEIELAPFPPEEEFFEVALEIDPPQETEGGDVGPVQVEIPANWETMQHLGAIALAKKLLGLKPSDKMTAADARDVIGAEVRKRTGAVGITSADPALNPQPPAS